jgi:ParB family chromosome partitioning protein
MLPRKALGKGLSSLIPAAPISATITPIVINTAAPTNAVHTIPIDDIIPNRLQPRKHFNEEALDDLANSIRVHGIIQPIVVCPLPNGRYELIAGERRWRASKKAGLTEVSAVFKEADDQGMLELAIIENIQREDLDPLEEAQAYQELMKQFGYSQEQVADKVGKSRPAVANSLRLLNLPKLIQEDIALNRMTAGHARALLSLGTIQDQLTIREQILRTQLTVRDVERIVQFRMNRAPKEETQESGSKDTRQLSPQWKQVQEDLTMALGTKVILHPNADMKGGKIIVEFYSTQDLSRMHDLIVDRT